MIFFSKRSFWILVSAGSEVINHLGVSWIHAELRLGSDPEVGENGGESELVPNYVLGWCKLTES